jgi:hypothetical protein
VSVFFKRRKEIHFAKKRVAARKARVESKHHYRIRLSPRAKASCSLERHAIKNLEKNSAPEMDSVEIIFFVTEYALEISIRKRKYAEARGENIQVSN